MSQPTKIQTLLAALESEISRTVAGSTEGQFPILDLLGNIRDEAAKAPGHGSLADCAGKAWEALVTAIESSQPFTPEQQQSLRDLRMTMAGLLDTPAEPPAPAEAGNEIPFPAPTPSQIPEASPPDADEETLILNIAQDVDLLREFLNESREHLDNIEQGVLVWERQPGDSGT